MPEPRDPLRLADGAVSSELRRELVEARAVAPSGEALARMAASLGPLLGHPASPDTAAPDPSGAATGASAAGLSPLAKAGAVLVVVGATVGFLVGRGGAPETSPRAPLEAPAPRAAPARATTPPPAPSPPPSGERSPEPEVEHVDLPPVPTDGPRRSPTRATADTRAEIELLRAARTALRSDPARALALTDDHRRRFAAGVLGQEREVIAVEALARLGRSEDAKRRAATFRQTFPNSAHREKVESAASGR